MALSKFKYKHIGVFFQRYSGAYRQIGKKTIKLDAKREFSYRGKRFTLLFDDPIYESKNGKIFYFFDYNAGQILLNTELKEVDFTRALELLDDLANKHIVADILKASKQRMDWKQLLPYLIGFVGLGMFLGYFLHAIGLTNGWW